MPVVQPEKPWSPYPISHRDLKPSNATPPQYDPHKDHQPVARPEVRRGPRR